WLQAVEGLSAKFDTDLGIAPAMYEWMPLYSDNMGSNWMQTHAFYQVRGNSRESADNFAETNATPPSIVSSVAPAQGRQAGYFTLMRYCTADFVVRPIAATRSILTESLTAQADYTKQFPGATNFFANHRVFWSRLSGLFGKGVLVMVILAAGLFFFSLH